MQQWTATIEFGACLAAGCEGEKGLKWQLSRNPKKMGEGGYNPRVITQGSIEFTACEELVMVGSASQSASGVSVALGPCVARRLCSRRSALLPNDMTTMSRACIYPDYIHMTASYSFLVSGQSLQPCGNARRRACSSAIRRRQRPDWSCLKKILQVVEED
jgi:hypothetical protein